MLPMERFMVAGAVARVAFFGGPAFAQTEPVRVTRKAPAQGEGQVALGPASPDLPEACLTAASSPQVSEQPLEKALGATPETDGKERR